MRRGRCYSKDINIKRGRKRFESSDIELDNTDSYKQR